VLSWPDDGFLQPKEVDEFLKYNIVVFLDGNKVNWQKQSSCSMWGSDKSGSVRKRLLKIRKINWAKRPIKNVLG
jgi:hypothetical protein